MSDTDARAALRARQGAGARYDAESAPHDDLLLARRGTAFLARLLGAAPDAALGAPGAQQGWSRARIIARVSYAARAEANMLQARREGRSLTDVSDADIDAAALTAESLPPRALRSLFHHTEVHLNVEWRDIDDAGWSAVLTTPDERKIALRQLPRARAQAVWQAALDMGLGASLRDVPPALREALHLR